jgi:hypothetical protein
LLTNQSIAIVLSKDINLDQIVEGQRQLLMTDLKTLDQLYTHIMKTIVSTGVAPHYTEIAPALGIRWFSLYGCTADQEFLNRSLIIAFGLQLSDPGLYL